MSPIVESGRTRTWGVKRNVSKSCITIELIFACDWSLQSQILLGFPRCSWWMKCSQVLSCSSTVRNKTGKMSAPPKYFQLLQVTNVFYPPCPKFSRFMSYFRKNSGRLRLQSRKKSFIRETKPTRHRKVWKQSFLVDAGAAKDRPITLTKARPTHKHSQHSHSFSSYRCMVHGCFFCRALIGSRIKLNICAHMFHKDAWQLHALNGLKQSQGSQDVHIWAFGVEPEHTKTCDSSYVNIPCRVTVCLGSTVILG